MLSSVLAMLTPGGRQRQSTPANVPPNNVVDQDADADSPDSPVSFGDVQGQRSPDSPAGDGFPVNARETLRQNLFVSDSDTHFVDHKHGDFGDDVAPDQPTLQRTPYGARRSPSLPKIVHSKLVTLSLSNFAAYRESIKVCGYSRGWPLSLRDPSIDDLAVPWNGVDGDTVADEIRREAFMVLYQTIPSTLKYLVEDVPSGDVTAVWNILYDRFLHVTDASLKKMKQEWESLSQGSTKLDEFISLVSSKARSMLMVKIPVSNHDKAVALVQGLSKDYDWLKNHFSMMAKANYSFADVATAALKFAIDKKMVVSAQSSASTEKSSSSDSSSSRKEVCYKFNTKGCANKSCRYRHDTVSPSEVKKLKDKIDKNSKSKSNTSSPSAAVFPVQHGERKPYCFKCFSKDHLIADCPLKKQINEYINKLTGFPQDSKVNVVHSSRIVLPVFMAKNDAPKSWIIDSGAAHHITNNFQELSDPVAVPSGSTVFTVGNDHVMSPTHSGSVMVGGVKVTNVFLCQECPVNILSESRLMLAGLDISKSAQDHSATLSKEGQVLMTAVLKNGLFVIDKALNCTELSPL